jgi:Zn-dependent M28 family amino/carboxypeptidase
MSLRGWAGLALAAYSLLSSRAANADDAIDSPPVISAARRIRPAAIRAHMQFLSDSLLQGRAPDTPGFAIAALYVASELEAIGLEPSPPGGSWFQMVPFRKSLLDQSKSSLVFLKDGKPHDLVDGKDYVLTANTAQQQFDLDAPLVFAGFGVTAPEEGYDDYAGINVHGKIVAIFGGAPPRFASTVRAYYADDMVKARNAESHGAAAIISLYLPEDFERQPWDWNVPQYRMGEMRWLDKDGKPHNSYSHSGIAALNQSGADILFNGAPHSFKEVCETARAGKSQGFPLGWSARVHASNSWNAFQSPNIVARLEGSDTVLRHEYVVYTAHVDHLGICPPIGGDNVCHGADDNASGVASLLEIARAYSSLPSAPRRSILFVFVTGEEVGLLGSDYFAHYPSVPLDKIVANINIDCAPGLFYPMKNVVAMGAEHSTLQKNVESVAAKLGYTLAADPMPEENYFIRSDQYSFVLRGIPAIDVSDGPDSTDPNINGLEFQKKWNVTRYHTPLDNMEQPLNFPSAARASAFNFLLGISLADQDRLPAWNQNDFFGVRFGPLHASREREE